MLPHCSYNLFAFPFYFTTEREISLLTDGGDNSPSEEKGGTHVPEARLIG